MHPVIKTLLNPQIRLDQAVLRLFEEMTRFIHRLATEEMQDQVKPRRLLDKRTFHGVRGRVANWALLKVSEQWDQLVKKKNYKKEIDIYSYNIIERYILLY